MKALQEYFRGHEQSEIEWEKEQSRVYPRLDTYQKDGYHNLLKNTRRWNGAFLCDAVGLGKTFVGLMIIERLAVHERKRVALFAPKSALLSVWKPEIERHLKHLTSAFGSNLITFAHTDLLRTSTGTQEKLDEVADQADAIVIDEAHHFRNMGVRGESGEPRKSRYWRLYDIAEGKEMYLLTATPVNNRITDLMHMIQLFSRHDEKGAPPVNARHFTDIGIHSLPGHFRRLEKALNRLLEGRDGDADEYELELNMNEAEQILSRDTLYKAIVVQRSRTYVKKSLEIEADGSQVVFPKKQDPKLVEYSIRKTYGRLLKLFEDAFDRKNPLFTLATYYPLAYWKHDPKDIPAFERGRQKQVVSLVRTLFLKIFESSPEAFEMACWRLTKKLLAWVKQHAETKGEKHTLESWMVRHDDLTQYLERKQMSLLGMEGEDEEEDFLPQELVDQVEHVDRKDYDVSEILTETFNDLDTLAEFLRAVKPIKPSQDDKLKALIRLLKSDPILSTQKVLIFTEFTVTARYLKDQLQAAGIEGVDQIDSHTIVSHRRGEIIKRFAPYYNGTSSAELAEQGREEIRVLISTDVLSEGLNLQDATRLINFDIHWNPVRLMQRIGRVDRRLDPEKEADILRDHPEQESVRGNVAYWNFLPPNELDELLALYGKVAKKTLRISKTFGIEGGKLLTPEDEYEDLRLFNAAYEEPMSPEEEMRLKLKNALKHHPDLAERLDALPGRVFSGRKRVSKAPKGVFFCYALPGKVEERDDDGNAVERWRTGEGPVQWYYLDREEDKIVHMALTIDPWIESTADTPRHTEMEPTALREARLRVEKHIKNDYMRRLQVGHGAKPALRAWMDVN